MSAPHSAPSVRKAVVPAAGLGTRFLPATTATPKETLPVVDKPAIQYVMEATAVGLDDAPVVRLACDRPDLGPEFVAWLRVFVAGLEDDSAEGRTEGSAEGRTKGERPAA